MKISQTRLKQLIKEEIKSMMNEDFFSDSSKEEEAEAMQRSAQGGGTEDKEQKTTFTSSEPSLGESVLEEEEEELKERALSSKEGREKENIVRGMKKEKKSFEGLYGDDAESVMYATATKLAKKNA